MQQLNLAIVGHTNVGKTSLLRTLARSSQIGEVQDSPGTTRHVEQVSIRVNGAQRVNFFDTPGLEDSIALYDYIIELTTDAPRLDGIDKLEAFLAGPEAKARFEQEAKVIRQLLHSDAALYVVDVREPVLERYHDELAILALSNKPLLAVLNFTAASSNHEAEWKSLLARVGIHAITRFDAVLPAIDGEQRLYQSLALLLEDAAPIINQLLQQLAVQEQQRYLSANRLIAETLIDITALSRMAPAEDKLMVSTLQQLVREREEQAIQDLLALYQFEIRVEQAEDLPLIAGRFRSDLFHPETLKQMGISFSKGFVSGAMAGAGIDLAVGGIALGSATLIGAAIGGLSEAARRYGSRISRRLAGQQKMSVDDAIICLCSLRLQQLRDLLTERAHANLQPLLLPQPDYALWQRGSLPKVLRAARAHPEWSSLNKPHRLKSAARQTAVVNLANQLSSSNSKLTTQDKTISQQ